MTENAEFAEFADYARAATALMTLVNASIADEDLGPQGGLHRVHASSSDVAEFWATVDQDPTEVATAVAFDAVTLLRLILRQVSGEYEPEAPSQEWLQRVLQTQAVVYEEWLSFFKPQPPSPPTRARFMEVFSKGLTVQEAAAQLGISQQTYQEWRERVEDLGDA